MVCFRKTSLKFLKSFFFFFFKRRQLIRFKRARQLLPHFLFFFYEKPDENYQYLREAGSQLPFCGSKQTRGIHRNIPHFPLQVKALHTAVFLILLPNSTKSSNIISLKVDRKKKKKF